MQAEAILVHARAFAFAALLLAFASPACAQTEVPGLTLPTAGVTVPPPSGLSPTGPPDSGSSTSSGPSGSDPGSWPPESTTRTKCRGCVPPGLTTLSSGDRSSDKASLSSDESAGAHLRAMDSAPSEGQVFDTAFALPGFGLLVGAIALVVVLRRRRR